MAGYKQMIFESSFILIQYILSTLPHRNLCILLIVTMTGALAVDLQCRYGKYTDWHVIDDVYYCDLNQRL